VAEFLRTEPHEFPLRIRLTRKLAAQLNGFDLSRVEVGDVLFLPEHVASMLIREGWAERVDG
jgi:hypothetical protein